MGHGVAVGAGMAWALTRGIGKPSSASAPSARAARACVYVLLGDGELDAGVVWEGVMTAAKYRLGNLTTIVDANAIQQTGATADVMPTEPLVDRGAIRLTPVSARCRRSTPRWSRTGDGSRPAHEPPPADDENDQSRHDPGEVVERDCGDHRKGEPGTPLPFESLG